MGNKYMTFNILTDKELEMLKGKDIKAVTKREKYIRALYNESQEIPKPITKEDQCFCIAIAHLRKKGE